MNGRNLVTFICVLFVIGIVWMIIVTPKGETSRTDIELFEPITPAQREVVAASEPSESPEGETAIPPEQETPPPSQIEEPKEEKPGTRTAESAPDEPPEVVEYTPGYGEVTFTHMMHAEDYEIDCGACHHEDMEGGMSRCANCHESLKQILHKNCQGCHKKLKTEGKETGPVKCRECHIK